MKQRLDMLQEENYNLVCKIEELQQVNSQLNN